MRKFVLVLLLVLSILALASCATKAPTEEATETVPSSFPYECVIYSADGSVKNCFDIVIGNDPSLGLVWTPWFQDEASKASFDVYASGGIFEFEKAGNLSCQKYTFMAIKPVEVAIFGFDMKDNADKVISQIVIALTVDADLNIRILDHKASPVEE